MRRGRHVLGGLALFSIALALAACDKKSDSPAGGGGPTTTASAASNLVPIKYEKQKLPPKGTHATVAVATKGGNGATRPGPTSKKLSEAGTDREMRKAATLDVVDC